VAPHVLWTDGASRGNPGPAATGFVILDADGAEVAAGGRYLGIATNNVAEYEAVLEGLRAALELGLRSLDVRLDSELVVRQLSGRYKVKDEKLKPLHRAAVELIDAFEAVEIVHVPRERNEHADALANEAIDEATGVRPETAPETEADAVGTYELRVSAHFDAAHALLGYPGECRALHGHTWEVEVTVAGTVLDDVGIVYDFKRLKDDVGGVLEAYDHAYLNEVPPFDELNPTAEHLAREIHDALEARVGEGVVVREVAVWESPTARIAYRKGGD
jgi:queuosine biosynthesis protein QueD